MKIIFWMSQMMMEILIEKTKSRKMVSLLNKK